MQRQGHRPTVSRVAGPEVESISPSGLGGTELSHAGPGGLAVRAVPVAEGPGWNTDWSMWTGGRARSIAKALRGLR